MGGKSWQALFLKQLCFIEVQYGRKNIESATLLVTLQTNCQCSLLQIFLFVVQDFWRDSFQVIQALLSGLKKRTKCLPVLQSPYFHYQVIRTQWTVKWTAEIEILTSQLRVRAKQGTFGMCYFFTLFCLGLHLHMELLVFKFCLVFFLFGLWR